VPRQEKVGHFHIQDNVSFCGEAAAQMVFEAIGGTTPDQCTFGGQELSANDLCQSLNDHLIAGGFAERFEVVIDSWADGVRRIADICSRKPFGVPTMEGTSGHWILVSGVVFQPGEGVRGFFINDPRLHIPARIEHKPDDDCGTGIATGGADWGAANVYVTLPAWQAEYWQCDIFDTTARFVSIVPVGQEGDRSSLHLVIDLGTGRVQNAVEACSVVARAIDQHHLRTSGPLAGALAGVTAASYTGFPNAVLYESTEESAEIHETTESRSFVTLQKENATVGNATLDPEVGRLLGVRLPPSSATPIPGDVSDTGYTLESFTRGIADFRSSESKVRGPQEPGDDLGSRGGR
jgi:hypothetical protein